MVDYLAWDRPSPTRYEHGIDAKIVVMGNTGSSSSLSQCPPHIHSDISAQASERRVSFIGIRRTNLIPRTSRPQPVPSSSLRRSISTASKFASSSGTQQDRRDFAAWSAPLSSTFQIENLHSPRPPCITEAPTLLSFCMI